MKSNEYANANAVSTVPAHDYSTDNDAIKSATNNDYMIFFLSTTTKTSSSCKATCY